MSSFVEDYLANPTLAIASLRKESEQEGNWYDQIDEDLIYSQLASPEFHLYQEIILSTSIVDAPHSGIYSTVA